MGNLEIEEKISEYQQELARADEDVEKSDQADHDYKRALFQDGFSQEAKDAAKKAHELSAIYIREYEKLKKDKKLQHLSQMRKKALGKRSEWDRKIKKLKKELRNQKK